MKIKRDNEKLQVISQCKSLNEMKYIIDTYIAGCEKQIAEARKALNE
jgi:hypothetical protein